MEIRYSSSLGTYVRIRPGVVSSGQRQGIAGVRIYYGHWVERVKTYSLGTDAAGIPLVWGVKDRGAGKALAFELIDGVTPDINNIGLVMDLHGDEYDDLMSRWDEVMYQHLA